MEGVNKIASLLGRKNAPAGTVIIRQGDPGEACYLLRSGEVEVWAEESGAEAKRRLCTMRAGALFGEAALLTGSPRNATVRALTDCELLILARSDFLEVIGADGAVGVQVIELLRLRDRPRQISGILIQDRTTAEGDTITILKDPRRGAYFRLSAEGRFIWERLDGRHTMRDLALDYLGAFHSFAPGAIAQVLGGLAGAGFIEVRSLCPEVVRNISRLPRWQRAALLARRIFNWRIAIAGVDGPLDRLYAAGIHLFYTRPMKLVLAGLAAAGFVSFLAAAEPAGKALQISPENFIYLIPAYLLAVFAHEAGHAFTVKAHGREVQRIGFGWYWFGPIAFVDTSDMWLAERGPRIAVNLAGCYANAVSAGIAALLSLIFSSPAACAGLWQFALVSHLMALVNLNPLMELDGYYALMDWRERPNLRTHILEWLGNEFRPALRRPRVLRAHWLELACAGGALLHIFIIAALAGILYRNFLQVWLARLIPGGLAKSIAWALPVAIVVWSLVLIISDLRAHKRRDAK